MYGEYSWREEPIEESWATKAAREIKDPTERRTKAGIRRAPLGSRSLQKRMTYRHEHWDLKPSPRPPADGHPSSLKGRSLPISPAGPGQRMHSALKGRPSTAQASGLGDEVNHLVVYKP